MYEKGLIYFPKFSNKKKQLAIILILLNISQKKIK